MSGSHDNALDDNNDDENHKTKILTENRIPFKLALWVWVLLNFPWILMNTLNETESSALKFCRSLYFLRICFPDYLVSING